MAFSIVICSGPNLERRYGQRLLAIVEQHLVEMRIRGDETKLLCFLVEDDPVCVRSKLYSASKEFFNFRGLGQASMNEMDGDRVQTTVR